MNQVSAWRSLPSIIPILNQMPKIVLERMNLTLLNLVSNEVFFCIGPGYAGNPLHVLENLSKVQRLPQPPHQHPLPEGTWVTISEPVSTHRHCTESTVDIRVHASCTSTGWTDAWRQGPSLQCLSVFPALTWAATNIRYCSQWLLWIGSCHFHPSLVRC